MGVRFSYADRNLVYNQKKKLKSYVVLLATREGKPNVELNYVFCSDEYLLDINRRFLDHDFYTDIITFDLGEGFANSLVGEVYISVDRVKDNAEKLGVSFESELCRVVFHGVLHLCGYKDKSKAEIARMRQAEDMHLQSYFGLE